LAGGSTGPGGADDSSTPKGFMKPSKIQMIDINESAAIHENIDKANAGKTDGPIGFLDVFVTILKLCWFLQRYKLKMN
jgi:hypothetical protein